MSGESIGRPATLEVDLDALARNYEALRRQCAGECGAVVKADAYGLGMAPVARKLAGAGCRHFFVARLAEGQALRRLLPAHRIYVFDGVEAGAEQAFADSDLIPVLNALDQVERWAPVGRPAVLHLDTGMTRLGLTAPEVDRLVARSDWLSALQIEFVMTHLACADEASHPLNAAQLAEFDRLRSRLPWKATSIGNSAGICLGEAYSGDLARPGIALYGGNPFVDRDNPFGLVASLKGRVLKVHDLEHEAQVGYGATYRAAAGSRIAVVAAGYADGVRRALGNRGFAAVAGQRVPIAGRVSMDLVCIDVSSLARDALRVGDFVELMGAHVSVDEIAALCDTNAYEILTGLGARLERIYSGEDETV